LIPYPAGREGKNKDAEDNKRETIFYRKHYESKADTHYPEEI
jgi:hypothetical protein